MLKQDRHRSGKSGPNVTAPPKKKKKKKKKAAPAAIG
jgi:hypothetical protein